MDTIIIIVVGNTSKARPLGHLNNWYQNPLREGTVFAWENALRGPVMEEETLGVWTQQKTGQLLCWRHEKASVFLIPGEGARSDEGGDTDGESC